MHERAEVARVGRVGEVRREHPLENAALRRAEVVGHLAGRGHAVVADDLTPRVAGGQPAHHRDGRLTVEEDLLEVVGAGELLVGRPGLARPVRIQRLGWAAAEAGEDRVEQYRITHPLEVDVMRLRIEDEEVAGEQFAGRLLVEGRVGGDRERLGGRRRRPAGRGRYRRRTVVVAAAVDRVQRREGHGHPGFGLQEPTARGAEAMGPVVGDPVDQEFDLPLSSTLRERPELAVRHELRRDRRVVPHTGDPQSVNQV